MHLAWLVSVFDWVGREGGGGEGVHVWVSGCIMLQTAQGGGVRLV